MGGIRQVLILAGVLVLGMTAGAVALAYLLAGEIYEYKDSFDGAHLSRVDAIVCLAGGRWRIAAAGDVWYRYWEFSRDRAGSHIPVLYISGMGPQANWNVLKQQLRRGVLEVIGPEHVVMETESTNTEANALWFARNAKQQGWKRILLVTSPYHMKRARFIFERTLQSAKLPMDIETSSVYQEPFDASEWRAGLQGIRVTLVEYLKLIYYRRIWVPSPAQSF